MPPFLAGLGMKDALYGALIVGLLSYGAWFVHHERGIGAQRVEASDARAADAQIQRDYALQTTAALATSIAQGDYTHAAALPVTDAPVPVGLCRPARNRGPVPAAAAGNPSRDAAPTNRNEDAGTVATLQRFADAALQIARDADLQIAALQADNRALRSEMENANAPK